MLRLTDALLRQYDAKITQSSPDCVELTWLAAVALIGFSTDCAPSPHFTICVNNQYVRCEIVRISGWL